MRRRPQRTVNKCAGDRRSWAPAPKLRVPRERPTRDQLDALRQRFQPPLVRDHTNWSTTMKSYDDPSDLPPTKEQRQRQAEEFRRTMRWWRDYFREHPVKTMEQLAKEEPEICTLCGEIGEAHWFDGERIHCPERTVN